MVTQSSINLVDVTSAFGNLESTTEWLEVLFNIIVLTSGLILVTVLIVNIKVFLHATTSKKQAMQLKMRNIEWWMRKRHLPPGFQQRVLNYEWPRVVSTNSRRSETSRSASKDTSSTISAWTWSDRNLHLYLAHLHFEPNNPESVVPIGPRTKQT